MKKLSKKVKILLVALASTVAIGAVSLSTVTYASYVFGKKTKQNAYGLGGERQKSIFFNPNVWTKGTDSSGNVVDAIYYLYVWKRVGNVDSDPAVLSPSVHVTPTIPTGSGVQMDLFVYEFDTTSYNMMLFLRWDPSKEKSLELTAENGLWNQTIDIADNANINYYCIDSWGTGNPAQATPTTNEILKASNGNLSWRI